MWWLLGLLPAFILSLSNCSSNREEVKTKKQRKSALKKPKKQFESKKSPQTSQKKVSFKEGKPSSMLPVTTSTSLLANAAILADERAAALASAPLPSPVTPTPIPQVDLRLKSEPGEVLCSQTGSLQSFNLINPTQEPRAFKVKCSDNQLYRVKPVFGVVDAKGQTKVEVLRANGSIKLDRLIIVATKMTTDDAKRSVDLAKEKSHTVIPLLVEAC